MGEYRRRKIEELLAKKEKLRQDNPEAFKHERRPTKAQGIKDDRHKGFFLVALDIIIAIAFFSTGFLAPVGLVFLATAALKYNRYIKPNKQEKKPGQ